MTETLAIISAAVTATAACVAAIFFWLRHISLRKEISGTKNALESAMASATVLQRKYAGYEEGLEEPELSRSMETLNAYVNSHKADRMAILLARLYQKSHDVEDAISVIDGYIKAKEAAGERDRDYADALYNRACYWLMIWSSKSDEVAKERAYDDLQASLSLWPENKLDAIRDPDFKAVAGEDRFKRLIASEAH